MSVAAATALVAGGLQALAFAVYAAQVLRAAARPNGMSWVMWTVGTFVFLVSAVRLGFPASLLIVPTIGLCCAAGVAICAFRRGVWLRPARQDWAAPALVAAFFAALVAAAPGWAASDAARAFVAVASASVVASFWPTLRRTFLEPRNERPVAWFVRSAACASLALAIMLEGMSWPFLVAPIVSLSLNLLVALLALDSGDSLLQTGATDAPAVGTFVKSAA